MRSFLPVGTLVPRDGNAGHGRHAGDCGDLPDGYSAVELREAFVSREESLQRDGQHPARRGGAAGDRGANSPAASAFETFGLQEANRVLKLLKTDGINGSGVLLIN